MKVTADPPAAWMVKLEFTVAPFAGVQMLTLVDDVGTVQATIFGKTETDFDAVSPLESVAVSLIS
jgi:hypothetical protein